MVSILDIGGLSVFGLQMTMTGMGYHVLDLVAEHEGDVFHGFSIADVEADAVILAYDSYDDSDGDKIAVQAEVEFGMKIDKFKYATSGGVAEITPQGLILTGKLIADVRVLLDESRRRAVLSSLEVTSNLFTLTVHIALDKEDPIHQLVNVDDIVLHMRQHFNSANIRETKQVRAGF